MLFEFGVFGDYFFEGIGKLEQPGLVFNDSKDSLAFLLEQYVFFGIEEIGYADLNSFKVKENHQRVGGNGSGVAFLYH